MTNKEFEKITGISTIKMNELDRYCATLGINQKNEIFSTMGNLCYKKGSTHNIAMATYYLILNEKYMNKNEIKIIADNMKRIWAIINNSKKITYTNISNILYKDTKISILPIKIEETMDMLNELD